MEDKARIRHISRFMGFWLLVGAISLPVFGVSAQDCPSGMVSYWTFDDGTGKEALGVNDATVVGAVPATGKVGGALWLDGIDDYILASKSPGEVGLHQNGWPDVTMVAWFKIQHHAWFDQSPLVAIGASDYWPHRRYVLSVQYYHNPSPRLMFWGWPEILGSTNLEWDRWYQAALVIKNSSPRQIQLLLDGESEAQYDGGPAFPINDENIRIGYMVGWFTGSHKGALDEVVIFDRALSMDEIRMLYLKSAAGHGYCAEVPPADTAPPILSLPGNLVLEATGPDGAVATYTVTAQDAVDGPVPVALNIGSGSTFSLGTTMVNASATDRAGNTATGSFTVTVRDTTPPSFRGLTASPGVLWPPNHEMIPVALAAVVYDAVDPVPSKVMISVTSNETANGSGTGNSSPDWEITGDLTLKLRAERSGGNSGRIYTIAVESRDASGNRSVWTATVTVPHDKGGK